MRWAKGLSLKRFRKSEDGQAVSELALTLPILLIILMGTMSLGMMIYTKTIMVYACSQGAELGSEIWNLPDQTVEERDKRIEDTTLSIFSFKGEPGEKMVTIKNADNNITVKLEYDFEFILPFADFLSGEEGIKLSYEATEAIQD